MTEGDHQEGDDDELPGVQTADGEKWDGGRRNVSGGRGQWGPVAPQSYQFAADESNNMISGEFTKLDTLAKEVRCTALTGP